MAGLLDRPERATRRRPEGTDGYVSVSEGYAHGAGFVAARCGWEVMGGLVADRPIPELTRRWALTTDDWDRGSANGQDRYLRLREEAEAYRKKLEDPEQLNWVRLEWRWF